MQHSVHLHRVCTTEKLNSSIKLKIGFDKKKPGENLDHISKFASHDKRAQLIKLHSSYRQILHRCTHTCLAELPSHIQASLPGQNLSLKETGTGSTSHHLRNHNFDCLRSILLTSKASSGSMAPSHPEMQ